MFKEDVTNNIYTSWMETISADGYAPPLPRPLNVFTKEEIHHLIWLLHEELKQRPKGVRDAKVD
jgi:hypothetical protein